MCLFPPIESWPRRCDPPLVQPPFQYESAHYGSECAYSQGWTILMPILLPVISPLINRLTPWTMTVRLRANNPYPSLRDHSPCDQFYFAIHANGIIHQSSHALFYARIIGSVSQRQTLTLISTAPRTMWVTTAASRTWYAVDAGSACCARNYAG